MLAYASAFSDCSLKLSSMALRKRPMNQAVKGTVVTEHIRDGTLRFTLYMYTVLLLKKSNTVIK